MQPNDTTPVTKSATDGTQPTTKPDRDLAVALMRQQIDRLYDSTETQLTTANRNAVNDQSEHSRGRFYDSDVALSDASRKQWQEYHTAWQQYYQQYYERYYIAQQYAREQQIKRTNIAGQTNRTLVTAGELQNVELQKKAAVELKGEITKKIKTHSKRVRQSRHFVPIISAIVVMLVFLFLQYNRMIFAQVQAFISPGTISPQNIILDPTTNLVVGPEPRIIIPKINVDAPIVYGLTTLAEPQVQAALKNGVIHYPIPGANANPGEKGNAVFLGHSSNDVFDDGRYKFIFVQLEQLTIGDTFYLHFNSTRYTYRVSGTETILPNEVSKLVTNSAIPTATLVTCTPVGTAQKRFLVHADQISPDPTTASSAPVSVGGSPNLESITGNSPTLFQRLFGW
ncbi:MAG: sortase [Candidatus Saccharimonadales bacterium]